MNTKKVKVNRRKIVSYNRNRRKNGHDSGVVRNIILFFVGMVVLFFVSI